MKKVIAEAARKLVIEENKKRITVTDIVEECNITRQAFYYHFENISDMLYWILERNIEELIEEIGEHSDIEAVLRHFFIDAISISQNIEKARKTNYRDEVENFMDQGIYRLLEALADSGELYNDCSYFERKFMLRYHSQAIFGILRSWTDDDTKNLDKITHQIYLLLKREF